MLRCVLAPRRLPRARLLGSAHDDPASALPSWLSTAARTRHLSWWLATQPVQLAGCGAWAIGEATAHAPPPVRSQFHETPAPRVR